MNSLQIDRVLRKCKVSGFLGVFPSDRIPERARGLMVINLDASGKPGTHWVGVCVSEAKGEYFDTFGRPPSGEILKYLKRNCKRWIHNKQLIQSAASKYCGHYCILYCILRSRGVDLNKFVSLFSKKDTGLNDMLVSKIMRSINK